VVCLDILALSVNYLAVLDSELELGSDYIINLAAACELFACFLQLVVTVLERLNYLCSIA